MCAFPVTDGVNFAYLFKVMVVRFFTVNVPFPPFAINKNTSWERYFETMQIRLPDR